MVETFAWPSHSWILPGSAPRSRASVAAVARKAWGAEVFSINPDRLGVFSQDAVVNGPVGERPVGLPPPRRVFDSPEERPLRVLAVTGGLQVIVDALRRR